MTTHKHLDRLALALSLACLFGSACGPTGSRLIGSCEEGEDCATNNETNNGTNNVTNNPPTNNATNNETNNDTNNVVVPCEPIAEVDAPDDEGIDADCDGIDGMISRSIFVADFGNDDNEGTQIKPMRTIQAAIDKAAADEVLRDVLIAPGVYPGPLVLAQGVNVHGGYNFNWERELGARPTLRGGGVPVVFADGIAGPTILDGLIIEAEFEVPAGENNTTIWIAESTGISLFNLLVKGGVGGRGEAGEAGTDGELGLVGNPGEVGCEDGGGGAFCSACGQPQGGIGGGSFCGPAGGAGGGGGHPLSPAAQDGSPGGGDTPGGDAGGGTGERGAAGETGEDGTSGIEGGEIIDGQWRGFGGEPGGEGLTGNGGGGGGGGTGLSDQLGCDSYGGAGGGGGGGGCGGSGGSPGSPGGGSFAILVLQSTVEIAHCEIIVGNGGGGGSGGRGGRGAEGGGGGTGGNGEDGSFRGGRGGPGGRGGSGGFGGGGAGGPAYGIYSDLPWEIRPENIEFVEGNGGRGGMAGVNSAADGVAGTIQPFVNTDP